MTSPRREAQELNISWMTEHDLLEVVEIEESCGLSRWGWEAYHAELAKGRDSIMLVARVGNGGEHSNEQKVKGFIAARLVANELHINNVAVRRRHRRLGIAKTLLELALTEAKSRGAWTAFLEVRAGNAAAQALYERCGFKVAGRRTYYYTQPLEDALVMSRAI